MRRARDLDQFLTEPRGAFLEGAAFAFYNLGTVCGWRVWGRPGKDDAHALVQCIATAYAPGAPRYFSLVDLRGLEAVDGAGFDVLLAYVASIRTRMKTQLVRQAVVRPAGILGAMSAGFYQLLQPQHRVRVFDDLGPAAKWLRATDAEAVAALVAAYAAERPVADTLSRPLQAWLASQLLNPTPAAAARALAVSLRTMQRRLKAESTSFHAQVRSARVAAAQRLLADPALKLAAIAQDAGFPSSQQLATTFRAVTGMTPSEFRAVARRQTRLARD